MVTHEVSCGAVVFVVKNGQRLYLLLHYPAGHWDFPKGHVEKGESVQQCAVREIEEETGIWNVEFVAGFEEKIHYFFTEKGRLISKDVVYLLAKTKSQKVTLSFEHKGFEWLPFKEAFARITYRNGKAVLGKAEKFLLTR